MAGHEFLVDHEQSAGLDFYRERIQRSRRRTAHDRAGHIEDTPMAWTLEFPNRFIPSIAAAEMRADRRKYRHLSAGLLHRPDGLLRLALHPAVSNGGDIVELRGFQNFERMYVPDLNPQRLPAFERRREYIPHQRNGETSSDYRSDSADHPLNVRRDPTGV